MLNHVGSVVSLTMSALIVPWTPPSFPIAKTAVVIPNDGLRLCVDVVRVTRRDCDIDASQLVGGANTGSVAAANRIVARRAVTRIHGRSSSVRTAGYLVTKHEPVRIACD